MAKRKVSVQTKECVACGTCVKVCLVALFLFIKDFTQMSARNVWAAADVLRLVPRRSLKCRR